MQYCTNNVGGLTVKLLSKLFSKVIILKKFNTCCGTQIPWGKSELYTITVPAGILQLGQSSSHSRGLFSALQQILQNTETKLARPHCHHGKFWYHNIETKELCSRKHSNEII